MAEQVDDAEPTSSRRAWKSVGVLGTAVLVAMATAIGTGLGSEVLDLFRGDDEEADPISYSASEQISECGTHLFVPEKQASGLVSGAIPTPSPIKDWKAFQSSHGGLVADKSVVQVSIQGESSRTVTLTGINFAVDERRPRPPGAIFLLPCGDSIYGRYVVANLDRQPVAVSGTADDPKAVLNPVDPVAGAARSSYRPISFPWTVSVTDPLLLQIVASTEQCACTWRAEIPWSSGDQTGVIRIDNDGSGYTVVGSQGAKTLTPEGTGRSVWVELPSTS